MHHPADNATIIRSGVAYADTTSCGNLVDKMWKFVDNRAAPDANCQLRRGPVHFLARDARERQATPARK